MDVLNFRVAPSGDSLEVWVRVPDGPNYDGTVDEIYHEDYDIGIEKIAITDHRNYFDGYPDDKVKLEIVPETSLYGTFIKGEHKVKEYIGRIPLHNHVVKNILGLEDAGMYFLYVQTEGVPIAEVPCCCFKNPTIACAVNHYPVYNQILKIINAYEDRCIQAEDRLLDLYLKKKMITDAIELSDYVTAIDIYEKVYRTEIYRGQCLDACGNRGSRGSRGNRGNRGRIGHCVSCG